MSIIYRSGLQTFCKGLLVSVCLCAAGMASAQSIDTVERILKTHTIKLGVRDQSPPFSTLDRNGKAVGYSIDVCHRVVELIRRELKLPELKTQEIVVSASNRFSKLKDGSVDMVCGSTVITGPRLKEVDFSPAVMFGAQRFLTTTSSGISSQIDLSKKTVGVIKGSTGAKVVTALKARDVPSLTIVTFGNNQEALAALDAGKVQAISQMDIILQFVRLESKNPERLVVTQWPLTVEPIGFPVRKGDRRFLDLLNASLASLFKEKDFRTIYDKWFLKEVRIPPSALMMENMQRPSANPGMAFVAGVEL